MTNVINLHLQNITNMIIIHIFLYIKNDWYKYNMFVLCFEEKLSHYEMDFIFEIQL